MDILKLMKDKAQEKVSKILLIEGDEDRVIKAAELAVKEKICQPVLLGKKEDIYKSASKCGAHLDGIAIQEFSPTDEDVAELVKLREHKGMTAEIAKETLKDPNAYGALLLKQKKYDAALGGCKFSTAEWMRPVFQIVGKKEGVKTVSSVCFMVMKGRTIFYSDTDFIIKPDTETLAQIALNAAEFVKWVGVEPKLALLSYSTKGSGEHPSLQTIRDALEIVKKKNPDLIIDGEMQVDAAINPKAAEKKCPDSPLRGDANTLIFPDITVGNVLIHSLVQLTNYEFYGSFPVGLARPVVNGGRSMNPTEIYRLILGAAMEANMS